MLRQPPFPEKGGDGFTARAGRHEEFTVRTQPVELQDTQQDEEAMGEAIKTFEIERITPRQAPGRWVTGTIAGHSFEALVFREHAESESYELEKSRISKLQLRQIHGDQIVAEFDRGWSTEPSTPVARLITRIFTKALARLAYP